jgi:uncharacterized protein (UPF0335 family)
MTNYGGNSGEHLRQFMSSIERLQEECAVIKGHIKDKFAEAKANGFDTKAMRKLLQEKKLTKAQREEEEAVLDTYRHALGMQTSFDFGEGGVTTTFSSKGRSVALVGAGRAEQTDIEDFTGAVAR